MINSKDGRKTQSQSQSKQLVHLSFGEGVSPIGGRTTNLHEMARLPLLPGAELPGLVQGLEIEPCLTTQLRPYLQSDVTRVLHAPQVLEHEEESNSVREAERWMLEAHARLLKSKAANTSEIRTKRGELYYKKRNILPFWKTTREIITQQALQSGMFINKKGKMEVAEFPDPQACEHLKSYMDNSSKSINEADTQQWLTVEKKIKFSINPAQIVFRNNILGRTYYARLLVQNAGSHSAGFSVRGPTPGGVFCLSNFGYRGQVLAPGLSASLSVSFKCRDKEDHSDSVTIISGDTQVVVPVSAKMDPPTLFSPNALRTSSSQLVDGLSSTVDCGRSFIGFERRLRLKLVNIGPTARFFFISESDWVNQSISQMRADLTVVMESFAVRPAYLRLQKSEQGELEVGFLPPCEGSHVSRLYVVCDNATVRYIDFIGDARSYSPDMLSFQGYEKTYNVTIEDEIRAQYCIYLGKSFPRGHVKTTFKLHNTSPVGMNFSWKEQDVKRGGERGVFQVEPMEGSVPPEGVFRFQAMCNTDKLSYGRHLAVFTFYIKDVPLAAFPEKYYGKIKLAEGIEECGTNLMQRVAIEHSSFEIWIDIIEPNILLLDNYIHMLTFPLKKSRAQIYLSNFSPWEVNFQWELPKLDSCQVQISHQATTILGVATHSFNLTVIAAEPGSYSGIIRGTLEGYSNKIYEVFLKVDVQSDRNLDRNVLLEPGILNINKHFNFNLRLPFPNHKNVVLEEYALKYLREGCGFLQRKQRLEDSSSVLRIRMGKKVEEIAYRLLVLSKGREHYYIEVLCDFQTTLASLKQSKFIFSEPLFIESNLAFLVVLRNHKLLSVRFHVERWFGADERLVEMEYQPSKGVLQPGQELPITVTIKPLAPGFASDVFIPIFVEGLQEPLVAQVICLIRSSEFTISWKAETHMVSVTWPEEEDKVLPQFPSEECSSNNSAEMKLESSVVPPQSEHVDESSSKVQIDCEAIHVLQDNSSEEKVSEIPESVASTVPYLRWPLIGGRYYGAELLDNFLKRDFEEPWTCESLNEKYKKLSLKEKEETLSYFSKQALYFDIKTFNESSKSILIRNESLQGARYKAKAKFFRLKKNPEKLDPVEVAEMQVYGRKEVDVECPELIRKLWTTSMQDNVSLGIKLKKKKGWIGGKKSVEVKVTVFGTAWGMYFDCVTVEIEDLPKFNVPILVRVTGHPLHFTFAPQETNPILRFPSVMPNTVRQKTVMLKNDSFLRLKVAWMMFSRPLAGFEPGFSVQLEVHPELPEHFCRVHITDYYGSQKARYYHISPKVLIIEPRSRAAVQISMDTAMAAFSSEHLVRMLTATAVGTVYICRDKEKGLEPIKDEYMACFRPDGFDMDQIILNLETKLEIPNIHLLNSTKNDVTFKVRTVDLFGHEARSYSARRTYILQNLASRRAYLRLHISQPFRISKILTKGYVEVPQSSEVSLAIQDIIEVEITLTLTEQFLYETGEENIMYIDYENQIRRDLICREKDYSEHVFPVYLEILKPKIRISMNHVDFGEIHPFKAKELVIHLTSQLGDEPYYLEMAKEINDVFKILSPKRGFLKAGRRTNLIISFLPWEVGKYQSVIRLVTCTPGCEEEILLTGCCVAEDIKFQPEIPLRQTNAESSSHSHKSRLPKKILTVKKSAT